jgi:hypothetical protein
MGSSSNPLTGSGWLSNSPGTANPGSGTSGGNYSGLGALLGGGDPLLSSAGFGLGSLFNGPAPANPQNSPTSAGGPWGNPGGYQNPWGANEIQRNAALNNIVAGQMKNQLAPEFAQLMQQYGGEAGNFFTNLMNLGSPYYQQQQQASFTQGNQQNQNAAAQARQQLASSGYGYTPSGANAAMMGGMAMQGSQNLAEQYLQNLFQNEQMQASGAQGLSSLAGLFNPTQLLSGTGIGSNVSNSPSFYQDFAQTAGGIQSLGNAAQSFAQAGAGCWIAEAIWGVNDPRTHLVRYWLNNIWAAKSGIGRAVMFVYRKIGRWVARKPKLVTMLKPLFRLALKRALAA